MSEPKFTPGPWKVHLDKRKGTACSIIEDRTGDCVARIVYRFHRGERNANGNLIATAPEMYHWQGITIEVLRQICQSLDTPDIMRVQLESLISLATPIQKKVRGEE